MAEVVESERQDGLLWRIARLHPAWMFLVVVVSFVLPAIVGGHLGELPRHVTPLITLVILVVSNLCFLIPVLYIYGLILLLSGRFHSTSPRRLAGASLALVITLTPVIGFFPLIAIVDAGEKNSGSGLLFLLLLMAAVVAYLQLLVMATKELVRAERDEFRWLLRTLTSLALFLWPLGFFWIQARVRRLVREFDTGNFSRLPLEAAGFSEDKIDQSIELTRRVRPSLAESYAELLIRRAGGSRIRDRRTAGGMTWEFMVGDSSFRLVFANDPPLFTLHSSANPEAEGLFTLWWRLKESN
jgi:hypothetical protein